MSKYYGKIGYGVSTETVPGVWTMEITERYYIGDFYKNSRSLDRNENLNDNIDISNKISIVSDPYALQNFSLIKYAEFMGIKWKVKNVEVEFPRLILTLGGEYNV